MIDIHINIGSNSGHRKALIERAVAAVRSAFPETDVRCSDIIETAPWGFDSPNPFLNIGMVISLRSHLQSLECVPTDQSECVLDDRTGFALSILRKLQEVQCGIDPSPHRDASGGYIDRAIDIDLIAIDDWVIDHPDLTLPHPRMHLRDFVLIPLHQLSPDWRHPIFKKTAVELLQAIL